MECWTCRDHRAWRPPRYCSTRPRSLTRSISSSSPNQHLDKARRRVNNRTIEHTKADEHLNKDDRTKLPGPHRSPDRWGPHCVPCQQSHALDLRHRQPSTSPAPSSSGLPLISNTRTACPRPASWGPQSPDSQPKSRPGIKPVCQTGQPNPPNNLAKQVKRVTFGFTSFTNNRIRSLLNAGHPD